MRRSSSQARWNISTLDVARDRRLVLLEVAIVFLIVVELLLSLLRMS